MYSFGYFPGVWLLYVDVLEHSICSIFIGYPAYEDGTDRVFRNVGIQQSDAGKIPKRIHTTYRYTFYVLLIVHLITVFVNDQLCKWPTWRTVHFFFFFVYLFIPILYMFRSAMCWSWGYSIVSIRPLVYVTLCRWPSICTCIPHGHLHRVTYTRGRIDTIDCPEDEHLVARNM